MIPAQIDIAVIGGGIVGMCAALDLAREGHGVLVLDDGRHSGTNANAGSLHVQMQSRFRHLYPDQVPGLEASLPLYVAAARLWAQLAEDLGTDFELRATGGLMVAEDAAALGFLAAKCAREAALGLRVHMLGRAELARIAPYLGPAVIGAELCEDEGKLNPLLANQAVRHAALARGVLHVTETPVTGLAPSGTGWRLATPRGTVRAGCVLLAAGAGTGALAAMVGLRVPTVAEPLHMNVTEATAPLIGHLVQHAERMITMKQLAAGQVVIGGGWPARLAPGSGQPQVEASSLFGNLGLAQHLVPRVGRLRLIRSWAGVNTTADGQCILGPAPGRTGLFFAVPGDAGYTLGPLVGRMAAAVMMGQAPGFDISRFGVARFAQAQSSAA